MDPYASSRVGRVCRYFLNGNCKFGLRCKYLHESSVLPSVQICQYFQKGTCWYGVHCKYLHVVQREGAAAASAAVGRRSSVPSVSSPSVASAVPDRRGSEPALPQAEATSTQQCNRGVRVNVPNPQQCTKHLAAHTAEEQSDSLDSSSAASQESVQRAEVNKAETSDGRTAQESPSTDSIEKLGAAAAVASSPWKMEEKQAFLRSKDITCGICMDKVFEKPNERDHVFGILPNCNHSFCLQCIITWRKTKDFGQDVVKSCPQCRVKSTFYMPNNYWVEGEEKEKLIVAFRERCRKKKCDYYMQYGCCPFKEECLYRHDPTSRCSILRRTMMV
ncbi:makorin, ring finger protein, 4 isoform X2 [Sphaeramia orbicularis]|uniref:makorin, ring finger protein, 4 isoform X2 n=1 Tax=Sphaeramia orbicularis TaxID=375764 RepID=UPI00117F7542|nr:E3 ubiquitin-protein ligase makorin-1-like isoform X2 [Sphaeramia orbicularis]